MTEMEVALVARGFALWWLRRRLLLAGLVVLGLGYFLRKLGQAFILHPGLYVVSMPENHGMVTAGWVLLAIGGLGLFLGLIREIGRIKRKYS